MTPVQAEDVNIQNGGNMIGPVLFFSLLGCLYIGLGLAMMADIAKMCRENGRSELRIRVLSPFVILGWPLVCIAAGVFIIFDGMIDFVKDAITKIYKG